ncbi:MAG TPA: cation transporting ATPase C-terminal domain-containing protein, partial [Cellulomonas sp.]|nr:cation transporting ATPase C-terminal domain-containing protein [Cellulomonas sp.]
LPLVLGPDEPTADHATVSMTMAFVVMGLGSVLSGLVLRREPDSGLAAPVLSAVKVLSVPAILVVLATELGFLQDWLTTQSLSGPQWLVSICLALLLPIVAEVDKVIVRRRAATPRVLAPQEVVVPARAR